MGHIRKKFKLNKIMWLVLCFTLPFMVRTQALPLLDLLDLVTVHVGNIFKFQLLIGILKPVSKRF